MTNTTTLDGAPTTGADETPKRVGGLSTMKLAELQGLAGGLGLTGTAKMRKSDLVIAIKARQSGGSSSKPAVAASSSSEPATQTAPPAAERPVRTSRRAQRPVMHSPADDGAATSDANQAPTETAVPAEAPPRDDTSRQDGRPQRQNDRQQGGRQNGRQNENRQQGGQQDNRQNENRQQGGQQDNRQNENRQQGGQSDTRQHGGQQDNRQNENRQQGGQSDTRQHGGQQDNRQNDNRQQGGQNDNRQHQQDNRGRYDQDDDVPGGRRRNRQRSRDRKRRGGSGETFGGQNESVEVIQEDDVLVPVAGILEVLDSYAFLRTSGYLPGENDVYVPLGIVKKNGLRKGDAVTGAVRVLREGEQIPARQKFNALVRLDTINGLTPEQSAGRVDFSKLTPLYPQERLRLETEPNILSTRLIDLIAPIGKGQRGLIVSPAKAGKTLILQAIANAITTNNPEAHLMVVLVDERPEEVTDMQRAVKGEVIASTFDRPATDHTTVAELAIERAKRLVEMGHDVVILL
ncbi:MAG: Rho termination factor N-terminal domain-containing protein, partial [Actinomycetota bacterium]